MKFYSTIHDDGYGNVTTVTFDSEGTVFEHDHRHPDWPDLVKSDVIEELFEKAKMDANIHENGILLYGAIRRALPLLRGVYAENRDTRIDKVIEDLENAMWAAEGE